MRGKVLIILLLVVVFVWWQVVFASSAALRVSFLDVGQGDAIFIEVPNGNQVLIDGGPGRGVLRALGEEMSWDDKTIDLVIATHPDADHVGGLPAVLERYETLGVMDNGQGANTSYFNAWQMAKDGEAKLGAKKLLATRGQKVVLGEDVYLDILYPNQVPNGKDTNDGSIVARLVYGQTEFLLTGDSPSKVENVLLNKGDTLESDVLKVGHHGSKTSSSATYVKAVKPKYAIISAGKNNRYGHPHPMVVQVLAEAGVKMLRTDELGTITCESDGEEVFCQ